MLRVFGKLFKVIMKMIEQLNGMVAGCYYLRVQILLVVTWQQRQQYKRGCLESSALVLFLAEKHIIQTFQKTCQTPHTSNQGFNPFFLKIVS